MDLDDLSELVIQSSSEQTSLLTSMEHRKVRFRNVRRRSGTEMATPLWSPLRVFGPNLSSTNLLRISPVINLKKLHHWLNSYATETSRPVTGLEPYPPVALWPKTRSRPLSLSSRWVRRKCVIRTLPNLASLPSDGLENPTPLWDPKPNFPRVWMPFRGLISSSSPSNLLVSHLGEHFVKHALPWYICLFSFAHRVSKSRRFVLEYAKSNRIGTSKWETEACVLHPYAYAQNIFGILRVASMYMSHTCEPWRSKFYPMASSLSCSPTSHPPALLAFFFPRPH